MCLYSEVKMKTQIIYEFVSNPGPSAWTATSGFCQWGMNMKFERLSAWGPLAGRPSWRFDGSGFYRIRHCLKVRTTAATVTWREIFLDLEVARKTVEWQVHLWITNNLNKFVWRYKY